MDHETDVVVVGGGATGVGVARDLSLRGVDVTLLDRDGLSAGTTGHTHGVLHSGGRYANDDPDGARECIRENRVLRNVAPVAVTDTGGLLVSCEADDPAYLEEKREACEACGIPTERLEGAALRERAPELPETVRAALAVPDAVVHPSPLVAATAGDAADRGARIETHTPVTDLVVEDDTVVGVETPAGTARAAHVVNAAGAWAGQVASTAGADLEMHPSKGVMVVVDREASAVLNRARPPSDGDIVVPVGGRAILGTTSETVADPDDYPREGAATAAMVEAAHALLPDLTEDEVVRSYWGVRPIPAVAGEGRDASRGFLVRDHGETDGVAGLTSVVGGKLTTHRLMAEATADRVCEELGVDADCETAETPLPDDADRVASLVERYDAASPADADRR
ncbi:FAD-dependent oxidoreductase [Salinirubellus salinus]|uniref:Glycerol-3-phosphate dehydrogenase n=1 Tax=Salinirubellus salinus TaxID=1364945 RepID=A0A9E7R6A9_9EURY|nr:FAD-dependent oxidoreductase [Salinirubellus salinus]UWM56362.1 FAD-dependent oxidoreductase [Salinirubellus salinus]